MLRQTQLIVSRFLNLFICRLAYIRDWVMFSGGRVIEAGNAALMTSWAGAYGLQRHLGIELEAYAAFKRFDDWYWYWFLLALGIAQGILTLISHPRANVLSGFLLLISCGVWTFITVMFADKHPIHTGITTYAVAALGCFIGGSAIMTHNDQKIPQRSREHCKKTDCRKQTKQDEIYGSASIGDKATTAPASAVRNDGGNTRRVDARQTAARWLPRKRYFYRVWRCLRDGCKRLFARRPRK